MKDATVLTIAGLMSITILETVNMCVFKTDGVILATIVAIVAGMVGYNVKPLVAAARAKLGK